MSAEKFSNWQSGQIVALICIVLGAILSFSVFYIARQDHDMKLLAIGGVLGFIAGMSATASTLLVGKPSGEKPADLPPGSVVQSNQSIQTPPITPLPIPDSGNSAQINQ